MNVVDSTFNVRTQRRNEMINITSEVAQQVTKSGIVSGIVMVFCPHTTGAITINENADPDVPHDILLTLDELLPQLRNGYLHNEGNSDSHVKSSLVGVSQMICIQNSRLKLGTWQGIFFCEFDGPRNRKVHVQIMG